MDSGGEAERLAPVTFLPGVAPISEPVSSAPLFGDAPRRPVTFSEEYWADDEASPRESDTETESGVAAPDAAVADDVPVDRDTVVAHASSMLSRSLGRRGLSVAEARSKLRTEGLTPDESQALIDDFVERGWLDDVLLAEQLVHSATTRKDMGTRAVRQLLVKRLVAREVVDAVIAELPDDDAERALEFARGKARSLSSLDRETALRRLTGQLARRGYRGSVAMTAARSALDEHGGGGSGVRFR